MASTVSSLKPLQAFPGLDMGYKPPVPSQMYLWWEFES